MDMVYIYAIKNINNGKRYIGQTRHPEDRKQHHFNALKRHDHPNYKLQQDWDIYGEEGFVFEEYEAVIGPMADTTEKSYIRLYSSDKSENGYNIQSGGQLTRNVAVETKEKISKNQPRLYGKMNPNWSSRASNSRTVAQYDMDGNLLYKYESIADAGRAVCTRNPKASTHITDCCEGKQTTAYGYKWQYASE